MPNLATWLGCTSMLKAGGGIGTLAFVDRPTIRWQSHSKNACWWPSPRDNCLFETLFPERFPMTRRKLTALLAFLLLSYSALAADPPSRRFISADSSKGRIAIIGADGKTEWEYKIGPLHDLHVLDDGHVLFQNTWTHLIEVDPKTNKVIWEYDSAKQNGNEGKPVEVHAFQRLADGLTMIAESGVSRIIE